MINVDDLPTGSVSIAGTATQGQKLTASNTLADIDGIPTTGPGAIKYQWNADGIAIAGATADTYVLTRAEAGKKITVTAMYTDLGGMTQVVGSGPTAAVVPLNTQPANAQFWHDTTKAPSDTKTTSAVDLTDAISILKMIVGLPVNANNVALSPYQALAADFDQSGSVDLGDAIGVLKMVVGLSAPVPTWKYYDDTKLSAAYNAMQVLNPKAWSGVAAITDTAAVDANIKLVGVLTGDVDGSWTGV